MAKKQYKVRVYRLHDLDIVSWICTREFNLVRAVYSVLKAFCKGETFLIETPPKREVDIPVSTLGRVYQRSLYLDPEEDEEVIELLDSIAPGYRNCFMKNLLRQYIVIPVDESFLAAWVDVGNYLHQFDVLKEGKKVIRVGKMKSEKSLFLDKKKWKDVSVAGKKVKPDTEKMDAVSDIPKEYPVSKEKEILSDAAVSKMESETVEAPSVSNSGKPQIAVDPVETQETFLDENPVEEIDAPEDDDLTSIFSGFL